MLTNINNPSDCCNICGRTVSCVAWSYLNDYRYCYLKNAMPSLNRRINYTNSYSGVMANSLSATTTMSPSSVLYFCNMESGAIYPGNDIGGYTLPNPSDCCNKCGQTQGCLAWSYLTATQFCYLKSALPTPNNRVSFQNSYSGTLIRK